MSLSDMVSIVWPGIFLIDLSRYVIAAGALSLLLLIFDGKLARRRIQDERAPFSDVRREIVFSLSTVLLFSLIGCCLYVGSQFGVFRIYGGDAPSGVHLTVEIIALVLLHDTYFYWAHRAMHMPLLFRRMHRLHHKSRIPTPWAAYSFAPAEAILEAGILPLSALLIPLHEVSVFVFVTHMILRNVVSHAGIELFPTWWLDAPFLRHITTTTHHDLHHSHGSYNFGLYFTWWDRWMRTEHPAYERQFKAVTQSPHHATPHEGDQQ